MPLITTKGYASPEVGKAYVRARELCRQVGETPQLVPVLLGLCSFYSVKGDFQSAQGARGANHADWPGVVRTRLLTPSLTGPGERIRIGKGN